MRVFPPPPPTKLFFFFFFFFQRQVKYLSKVYVAESLIECMLRNKIKLLNKLQIDSENLHCDQQCYLKMSYGTPNFTGTRTYLRFWFVSNLFRCGSGSIRVDPKYFEFGASFRSFNYIYIYKY